MENLPALIQTQAEALLDRIGFEGTVSVQPLPHDPDTYSVELAIGSDQHFLIGQYGVNLIAFQHLLRLLCRKATQERFNILVDVNGYLAEKRRALEAEAERALLEVEKTGKTFVMRPMLPYERKIIHTFFLENARVMTESVGTGPERKIEVRLKD